MKKIYFDHIAAARVLDEASDEMMRCMRDNFCNPQSGHGCGIASKELLSKSRDTVASLIGAQSREIYFTASGTESNNIALRGLALANEKKGRHIIVSSIEHHSVLHTAATLGKEGFEVTRVGVDKYGRVSPDDVEKSIRDDTVLASIGLANSEIGTIQPVREIAAKLKKKGVLFHTDAVAAAGQIPVNVEDIGADALSFAAQSFYGPPGAAGLYVRKGTRIRPLLEGGVQEAGIRPGTENLPAIAGMAKAAEIAMTEIETRSKKLTEIRDRIIKNLPGKIDKLYITGDPVNRLPGHASFCVEFIEGEGMLLFLNMEGIAVSSGSACTSKALKASHVLLACGVDAALAQGSIVASAGMDNSVEDADKLIEVLPPIVKRLREMSPLYGERKE